MSTDDTTADEEVTIRIVKGVMVQCDNPQCPEVFFQKRDDAMDYKNKHAQSHKDHVDKVNKYLAELGNVENDNGDVKPSSRLKLNCPTCKVSIGEEHVGDCDVARCLTTGAQRALKSHIHAPTVPENGTTSDVIVSLHVCGRDIWTGYYPGEKEAAEFGVPLMVMKQVGYWDVEAVRWKMPDDYHAQIQKLGLGPAISGA